MIESSRRGLTTCGRWGLVGTRGCCTGRPAALWTTPAPGRREDQNVGGRDTENTPVLYSSITRVRSDLPNTFVFKLEKGKQVLTRPTTPRPRTVSRVPDRLKILQCRSLSCTTSLPMFSRRMQ